MRDIADGCETTDEYSHAQGSSNGACLSPIWSLAADRDARLRTCLCYHGRSLPMVHPSAISRNVGSRHLRLTCFCIQRYIMTRLGEISSAGPPTRWISARISQITDFRVFFRRRYLERYRYLVVDGSVNCLLIWWGKYTYSLLFKKKCVDLCNCFRKNPQINAFWFVLFDFFG